MQHFSKMTLAISAAALLIGPALAQPVGSFGPLASPAMLLQNEQVRKELKITEEQGQKLQKVGDALRSKYEDQFQKATDLTGKERQDRIQELIQQASADADKGLAEILDAKQLTRLKQMALQLRGLDSFSNPPVVMALKLTDEQKEQIKTLKEEAANEAREIYRNNQGNREEAVKKFTALRNETVAKAQELLTEEQKKTWQKLTGAPFELKWEQPRLRPEKKPD